MDLQSCTITWNGDVYGVYVTFPCTAALVLEAFLGTHPDLRSQPGLALFTLGMTEVEGHEQVLPGADLVLRPRVVH